MTSSAWRSGESSAPNAAWMPPWAFEELLACSDPFVARPTFPPARSAATAAASPEAPLPITSTSRLRGAVATGRRIPEISDSYALFTDRVGNAPLGNVVQNQVPEFGCAVGQRARFGSGAGIR